MSKLYFCIERRSNFVKSWYITGTEKLYVIFGVNITVTNELLQYINVNIQPPSKICGNELQGTGTLTYDNCYILQEHIITLIAEFKKLANIYLYISKDKRLVISINHETDKNYKQDLSTNLNTLVHKVIFPADYYIKLLHLLHTKFNESENNEVWKIKDNSISAQLIDDDLNNLNAKIINEITNFVKNCYNKCYKSYMKTDFKPYKFQRELKDHKEEIMEGPPSIGDKMIEIDNKLQELTATAKKIGEHLKIENIDVTVYDDVTPINMKTINDSIQKLTTQLNSIYNHVIYGGKYYTGYNHNTGYNYSTGYHTGYNYGNNKYTTKKTYTGY